MVMASLAAMMDGPGFGGGRSPFNKSRETPIIYGKNIKVHKASEPWRTDKTLEERKARRKKHKQRKKKRGY